MRAAFEKVQLVLFEPLTEIGKPMASMMRQGGFEHVKHAISLDRLEKLLTQSEVDVLVLDLDVHHEEQMALVSDIRHARRGFDPFIIVIATGSVTTLQQIQIYIDAGFDHVLGKPYSPKSLLDRILDPTRRERRFIISGAYVGPERRASPRKAGREAVFDIPDRLTAFVNGEVIDKEEYAHMVYDWRKYLSRDLVMEADEDDL